MNIEILPDADFSIVLQLIGGYGNYNWRPSKFLTCSNCTTTTGYIILCYIHFSWRSCLVSETVKVKIDITCTGVNIPEAFTPNNSEHNNKFCAVSECIHEIKHITVGGN